MGWNARAEACSPPPPDLVHLPSAVPQGGLIVGQLRCSDCSKDDLVFESGGSAVAGTFLTVTAFDDASFFAFQPSASLPLTDANDPESGLFVGFADSAGVEQRVLITAADAAAPSGMGSVTSAQTGGGTRHECAEYSPSVYGLCSLPGYSPQTVTRAGVELTVEHGSQYLYRAAYSVTGETPVERLGLLQDVSAHWFDGAPAEVCYSLERVALDGTETLMNEGCFPTDDLGLGTVDEIYGAADEALASCLTPPEGEEERWCDHFAAAIAAQSCDGFPSDSCAAALEACDADGTITSGTGGSSGGGRTDDEADVTGGDDSGMDDAPGGGCSTAPGAAGGSWHALLALLALTAGVMRRRGHVSVRD